MFRQLLIATALGCVVIMFLPTDAAGTVSLPFVDDFEDGNATDDSPISWVPLDIGYASTIQDIETSPPDGELEYTMSRTTNLPGLNEMYAATTDLNAQDLSIRTQFRFLQGNPDDDSLVYGGIVARVTPYDPRDSLPENTRVYYAYAWNVPSRPDPATRTGIDLAVWDGPGDGWDVLTGTYLDLDVTQEDVILQMDLNGDDISARAWRPGEPMPSSPQISIRNARVEPGGIGFFSGDYTEPGDAFTSAFRWIEAVPLLAADFDSDRDVDGEDFLAWQANFGLMMDATKRQGDFDNDGDVDGQDFVGWQSEFGSVVSNSALTQAAVPEPTALALTLVMAGIVWQRRRSRFN